MEKVLAVIGSAPNWKEDLDKLKTMVDSFDVAAVGKSCKYEDRIEIFATYHPEDFSSYFEDRSKRGLNIDFLFVCHIVPPRHLCDRTPDLLIPYTPPSGSSSLLAVQAGLDLGYEKIVLCGCPLTGRNSVTYPYSSFRKGWIHASKNKPCPFSNVRSMSGWTSEFLGSPDPSWFSDTKRG